MLTDDAEFLEAAAAKAPADAPDAEAVVRVVGDAREDGPAADHLDGLAPGPLVSHVGAEPPLCTADLGTGDGDRIAGA